MKYGCCVSMLGNEADPVGMKYIRYLAEGGYDYIELPLAQIMDLTSQEFEILLKTLEEYKMPCKCCNNFFPASLRLTGENVSLEAVENYIRKAIDRAEALGAKVIVFGSSGAKNVPEGFSKEKAFWQIVKVLKIADQYVAGKDIQIAIEPLNSNESNIIINLLEGKKLMQAAEAANIKLLIDYYHFTVENECLNGVSENAEDIIHIHFAETVGRVFPKEILEKYKSFFTALKNINYQSRVSIEAYSKNAEEDIINAIGLMKNCIEN